MGGTSRGLGLCAHRPFPCPRVTDVPRAILRLCPSEGSEGRVSISGFPGDPGSPGAVSSARGCGVKQGSHSSLPCAVPAPP